ncbi:MAG: penicillin-binding protein 2 [bacterium]|nr:penicillin-binding protein 2 [bacterium]
MNRLRFIGMLFLLVFLLIWARLFYWQVIQRDRLSTQAQGQYASEYSVYPTRGKILSYDNAVIATNQPAYVLFAETKKLPSDKDYIFEVAKALEVEEASIAAALDTQKNWVSVVRKITTEQKQFIEKLEISGLGFEQENVRFYPEGSASAAFLGFVGGDLSGEPKGYFGLEGYYNEILTGKPGFVRAEKDAHGVPIPIGSQKRIEAIEGADLVLNIDVGIQNAVEQHLKRGIERYEATSGAVIVMRPKTGAIVAMASFPSYDQRDYANYDTKLYKNSIVADTFEPGSTFKVITMAAAINEKVIKPTTTYMETGPVVVQGYKIRTWNEQYGGKTNMTEVLERSSNVGMVFISQKLGIEPFYKYLREFGFGAFTGIDLQEEVSSPLRKRDSWKEIDLATSSFGQGIAVTPIQLIRGVAAIANQGELVVPKIANSMRFGDDRVIDLMTEQGKSVISPATASIVTEMMVSSVDNGDARWAKPKGFRIAGKTGTAQIPVNGRYDPDRTIASFIGFAPANDPEFIMLVILQEPQTSPWGSETAAPLFFDISRDLFAYLNVSPN